MLGLLVSTLFSILAVTQSQTISPPPAPSPSPPAPSPVPSPPPRPSPQPIPPLIFVNTTKFPILGNYTLGYVNNTVENRCHIGTTKFKAKATGVIDMMSFGVYSQASQETCGISFVLSTFPAGTIVGSSVLTTFTDLVMSSPGMEELIPFNVSTSGWNLVTGQNYTITIQPFTWATGNGAAGGSTSAATHCVFDVPYGNPGVPFALLGMSGPTAQPCGATPYTVNKAGDGYSIHLLLTGHAASVIVPSATSSVTPTPTSSGTPTPSHTGTPTGTQTPTGTPTITDTPTPTLAAGASPSNSPTSTRTPSRTPSISDSQTPSSSITPSATPTGTPSPTPSLRIGASPSVTPTETPGPTDSPSPTASHRGMEGLAAGPAVSAPTAGNTGALVGAAIGGALAVVAIIGLAIRYKIVRAEIKGPSRVKSWRVNTKKPNFPDIVINSNQTFAQTPEPIVVQNPSLSLRSERIKHTVQ